MESNEKKRRRARGSAWHWKQTDSWYFTPLGTKRRTRLLDENGNPIRGKENRQSAELALARIKVAGQWRPVAELTSGEEWIVAKVCSEYIDHCKRNVSQGVISKGYCSEAVRYLNQLCEYSGDLPVAELKKGHVEHWIEIHDTWRSPATQRIAIAIVLAAFNHAFEMHDVPNPLRGLKKPPARPRLHSLSPDEEQEPFLSEESNER